MVSSVVALPPPFSWAEKVIRLLDLIQMELETFVDRAKLACGNGQISDFRTDLLPLALYVALLIPD